MTALAWDGTGEKVFEAGVSKGVLYLLNEDGEYDTGVAWNGLTTITESPSGAEPNKQYADNILYANLKSAEEFAATLEAFTYPDEFMLLDGQAVPVPGVAIGQQSRGTFGLCYRTEKGNDIDGIDYGYKLHLVYGLSASPSEKAYSTINDSPEAVPFSWELTSLPTNVTGMKPTSIITIDSTDVGAAQLAALEEILYGGVSSDPSLPTPDEVINIMDGTALAANVVVAGDADSIDITGTTANYLFTVVFWDGNSWEPVVGGTLVNEAAAEALVLSNGIHRVTLDAADGFHVPVAQQELFEVNVT